MVGRAGWDRRGMQEAALVFDPSEVLSKGDIPSPLSLLPSLQGLG